MGAIFKTIDQEVKFFYPQTRVVIVAIALTLSLVPLPNLLIQILSGLIILSIGLMHGATDHLLFMNANGLKTRNSIPRAFFIKYIATLAFMAVFWWLSPLFAMIGFILVSSYHFGQTQWQYLPITEKSILKKALYLSWGVIVLGGIVILNPEESNELINSVLPFNYDVSSLLWIIYLNGAVLVVLLVSIGKRVRLVTLLFELIELGVILFFSLKGDLLLAFALFFGLWHSLRASEVQVDKLKEDQSFTWRDFIVGSLPFSLISILGIALLLFLAQRLNQQIAPQMLFLIAVSVLTMPHMIIYEEFYNKHDKSLDN